MQIELCQETWDERTARLFRLHTALTMKLMLLAAEQLGIHLHFMVRQTQATSACK